MTSIRNIYRVMLAFSILNCTPGMTEHVNNASETQIVTGSYKEKFGWYTEPLILKSSDQGNSWTWIPVRHYRNPSISATNAQITNTQCINNRCIASGDHGYFSDFDGCHYSTPMFLLSKDKGKNWTRAEVDLWRGLSESITTAHCYGKTCIAAGDAATYPYSCRTPTHVLTSEKATSSHGCSGYPHILFSANGGDSWERAEINDRSISCGEINITHCSTNDKCFASGKFFITNKQSEDNSIMLSSHNGGKNWNFITIANIAFSIDESIVNDFYCQDKMCLAVGSYHIQNGKEMPFILKSKDAGQSWYMIDRITGLPANFTRPHLDKISCNDHYCVSTGLNDSYDKDSNGLCRFDDCKNLITLTSNDGGETWKFVKNTVLPEAMISGKINSLYCNSSTCIMLGNYEHRINDEHYIDKLIFLISKDYGLTWLDMPKIENFPIWKRLISMNTIKCSSNNCYIVGKYDQSPLLLISHNSGLNWSIVDDKNIIDTPRDIKTINPASLELAE